MTHFWRLYRKDMRLLMGPGIALLVLPFFGWMYIPDVLRTFVPRYSIEDSRAYFYAVLFLYACVTGHTTGSRVQLLSLPARRRLHLAAPFAATITWAAAYPVLALSLHAGKQGYSLRRYHTLLPQFRWGDPHVFIPAAAGMVTWPILLCGIAALAYAVAIAVKRYPYLTGLTVFVAGTILSQRLKYPETIVRFLASGTTAPLVRDMFWYGGLVEGATGIVILMVAAIIYERFGDA